MTTKNSPLTILANARRALELHQQECSAWDFESDGGCPDCAECRERVRAAKRAASKEVK